jgi:hypothetical protein
MAVIAGLALAACSPTPDQAPDPVPSARFDARWTFHAPTQPVDRPCGDPRRLPPGRPCRSGFRLTVENVGRREGDVRCLIMFLDRRDLVVGTIEFLGERLGPGEVRRQDGVLLLTGPVDHHREHCAQFEPGALQGRD